jgi:phosphatidylglycerophosphate synthase
MNFINRLLIVLELLVVIVLSPILIVLLLIGRSTFQTIFAPALATLSQSAIQPSQVICVGVLVLLFAFAIILLLLEYPRSSGRRLRIQSVLGAEVLMSSDAITQQVEYSLDALTGVIKVRAQVVSAGRDKGVDVFVELWTTADADVKGKTEEAAGVARHVIEDGLGLKVGKVQIKLDQMKAVAKKPQTLPVVKS